MRKDIKFPTHADFPLASMIQKNETTTLVLALAITLGLIGGCFLAIAQSTGADLRRLLDSNSENPTSPATNELNRTYAIHHDAPQLWGEKSPVPPKVGYALVTSFVTILKALFHKAFKINSRHHH